MKINTRILVFSVYTAFSSYLVCMDVVHAQSPDAKSITSRSSVYVEPISLGEVQDGIGLALNVGAVVSDHDIARGIQKAADVFGLNLNVFVLSDPKAQLSMAKNLLMNGDQYVILDGSLAPNQAELQAVAKKYNSKFAIIASSQIGGDGSRFDIGFSAIREARASFVDQIPKYDQILSVAFPVTPLPDNFFQPSKYPYPNPLVRAARTKESVSANVHAHVSCNMVAQTGNMLHRTSSKEPNRLLMGMEGGNLSLHAGDDALDKAKLSAVMTSWVLSLDRRGGSHRKVLVENNGIESSSFTIGIHAPEELIIALNQLRSTSKINSFELAGNDELIITEKSGKQKRYRSGMFLIANDEGSKDPKLVFGEDTYGASTIDFYSTQSFVQQLVEILPDTANKTGVTKRVPKGGLLTRGGTTVSNMFGRPLEDILKLAPNNSRAPTKPYLMLIEGGFAIVTPEKQLTSAQLKTPVERLYLDLRGPLTSDQSVYVHLQGGEKILFRRTILSFGDLDEALNALRTMGMIEKWDYEGVRGRGLYANVVLHNFLGKHRKFMSSLATWPTENKVTIPAVRFYVDGMQRLNFAFITKDGWRQEFVEVPMRIPPVPRDVALYTGKSSLYQE